MTSPSLEERHVEGLLRLFDLGSRGRLSERPVASGRVGSIWRLDTDAGSWAVKPMGELPDAELEEILEGARFQEAAIAAGVSAPAVRRTVEGDVLGEVDGLRVRVQSWVEVEGPDPGVDPVAIGRLVAALHRIEIDGTVGVHPWYSEPVGEARWAVLVDRLRGGGAPFADELAALVPELVALEAYLGDEPRSLRTCHRDLWADNVRRTPDGSLCVLDFDNAGLTDPAGELAAALYEYGGTDGARVAALVRAYAEAGGPARLESPTDFAMPIAQLAHIVEEGCTRWLAATTDEDRADNESWVREYLGRPLTRTLIDELLRA